MKKDFTLSEGATHVALPKNVGRVAFTLAEVLITLGIIGVVAALTMPILIANYQKQKTVAQLKKAYTEISQALKLAETVYGDMSGWSYDGLPGGGVPERYTYFVENYILNYMKIAKVCKSLDDLANCYYDGFKRPDGSSTIPQGDRAFIYAITPAGYSMFFWGGGMLTEGASQHIHIFVDINGPKQGTNTIGKDVFQTTATFGKQSVIDGNHFMKSGYWLYGAGIEPSLTRDELLGLSTYAGALIQFDGWQIAPDYPW